MRSNLASHSLRATQLFIHTAKQWAPRSPNLCLRRLSHSRARRLNWGQTIRLATPSHIHLERYSGPRSRSHLRMDRLKAGSSKRLATLLHAQAVKCSDPKTRAHSRMRVRNASRSSPPAMPLRPMSVEKLRGPTRSTHHRISRIRGLRWADW